MRKAGRIGILLAGMVIILGIAVRADAAEVAASRGTFLFRSTEGDVSIWAEDIALLQDKISGISEEVFDPGYYAGGSNISD